MLMMLCACTAKMCGFGPKGMSKEQQEEWKKKMEECKEKYNNMSEEEKKQMEDEFMEKMGPMKKFMAFGMKMKKMHVDGGPVCAICLNNLAPKIGDSLV